MAESATDPLPNVSANSAATLSPNMMPDSGTAPFYYVLQYGDLAVELDALPPSVLAQRIRQAIEYEIDEDALSQEIDLYNDELDI